MTWKEAQLTLQLMAEERIGAAMRYQARQNNDEQQASLERLRAAVAADTV